MKNYRMRVFAMLISFLPLFAFGQAHTSTLSAFSEKWNGIEYSKANTANAVTYMNAEEKKVIEILNLVRINPSLFAESVLLNYPEYTRRPALKNNSYFKSLYTTLKNQTPLPLLQPDQNLYTSAHCHAVSAGKASYIGHERQTSNCSKNYNGECCAYGYSNALDIVLALLIDENIPSLGHRKIMLGNYSKIGVSIQPHKTYRHNAVLDFFY